MPAIANSDVVIPAAMPDDQRRELVDSLYAVHSRIFAGVERATFARQVTDPSADKTWILRHRDKAGAVVGYLALHVYECRLNATSTSVFRIQAGTLRDFRGGNASTGFVLQTGLRHMLAHPRRQAVYLGVIVHPSSYTLISRYCPQVWPRPDEPTPGPMLEFMDGLASEFELARVDARNPLVRHDGWRTIETEAERAYWSSCDKPAARFYTEVNPGYVDGHGLLTVVPLTPRTILDIGRAIAWRRMRGAIEPAAALTQRSFVGVPARRRAVARKLRAAEIFADAAEVTIRELAERSEILPVPGGRAVFHRGDASDELYLLARGAVYVVDDDGQVIDELGSGAVFGEMAMLGGERRSASIRTATRSLLVRIPRRVLLPLIERDTMLGTRIWDTYAERSFDAVARTQPRYGPLGRGGRRECMRRGERRKLAADEMLTVGAGAAAFIFDGAAEVQHAGATVTTRGATLLQADRDINVRSLDDVRLVLLPQGCLTSIPAPAGRGTDGDDRDSGSGHEAMGPP